MNLQQAMVLFRAQYLGQPVFKTFGIVEDLIPSMLTVQNGILLLRTVNQLTDGELLMVATILHSYGVIPANQTHTKMIKDAKWYLEKFTCYYSTNAVVVRIVNQILLRIGIILSFTYLNEENQPTTLQPDEIVSLGWAKVELQEGKK